MRRNAFLGHATSYARAPPRPLADQQRKPDHGPPDTCLILVATRGSVTKVLTDEASGLGLSIAADMGRYDSRSTVWLLAEAV